MPDEKCNPAEFASEFYLRLEIPIATHRDTIYYYRDGIYVPQDDGQVLHDIREFIATARSTKAATAAMVRATFDALKQLSYLPASADPPFWRDGRTDRPIVMANGLLGVQAAIAGDGQPLAPHSPDYFAVNKLTFAFDLTAECPAWNAFVAWFTQGDQKITDLLHEFVAWCVLLPFLMLQRFIILLGNGANGKSTFSQVVANLVGIDNISSVPIEQFDNRFALVQTLGKLLNLVSDCNDIDRSNEGQLKQFVGGDIMFFDRKNRMPIVARPTAKLWIGANKMPRFRDRSNGLWRRLIPVPCRAKVQYEQINLADELIAESAGIFAKCLLPAARRLAERRRFEIPAACLLELAEARQNCNPAQRFCDEQLIAAPDAAFIAKDELYTSYREWCQRWGFTFPLSCPSLEDEIKAAFPTAYRTKRGPKRGYRAPGWAGIEWRNDREFADEQVADFANDPTTNSAHDPKPRIYSA